MSDSEDQDPTRRFTNRVADYILYRPSYPLEIVDYLRDNHDLTAASTMADVGSGTGFLATLFLDAGCSVFAVEPNVTMRTAAEQALSHRRRFVSIDGRAEATTLSDHSVDLVTAGQAFHWFDQQATKTEFRRILRPGRTVALVWNNRDIVQSSIMADYEAILHGLGRGYRDVNHRGVHNQIGDFFVAGFDFADFPNQQKLDRNGLRGRFLSSSYAPLPASPQYEITMSQLDNLFETHQEDGLITFFYRTEMFVGRLS